MSVRSSTSAHRRRKGSTASLPTVRICLAALGLVALAIGLPASFAPETFYTDYPFYTSLVELLPPYNEHLITDIGGLYLGFGVMFIWAAFRPSRQLIVPLCAGWVVTQALHFAFHIGHLTGFTTLQSVTQTIGLGLYILVALVPIAILSRP